MAAPPAVVPILDATIVHEKRSSAADRVAFTTKDSDIRVIEPHEYSGAANCLAEAFRDDDVVRYPIDTPDRAEWSEAERFELHKQTMEYLTYAHCLKGLVTTVGPNYDCVALWMPPGKDYDLLTTFRSGMWRLNYKLSKEGRARFFNEFLPLLTNTMSEVLGERASQCWYLNYIGTKEGSRGRGYAKKLIGHITARADEEQRPIYLESSHDINVVIYGKLGFKLIKQIYLTRGDEDMKMDVMVREPVLQGM